MGSDAATAPRSLLVGGGARDPNVIALVAAAERAHVPVHAVLVGDGRDPWVHWDLHGDTLVVDGELLGARAAFVRHDVFEAMTDKRTEPANRALAWFHTLAGWVDAHPHVRRFNRRCAGVPHKPAVLVAAARHGLTIPRTVVSNHRPTLATMTDAVVKPVAGGGLCVELARTLDDAAVHGDALAAPAIVQPRLCSPELRVYVVGGELFGFDVVSPELDYRKSQSARLFPTDVPPAIAEPLLALADELGLDFAAADLKTCATTGALMFLEINTGPMFAAFDAVSGGALTDAMVRALCSEQ